MGKLQNNESGFSVVEVVLVLVIVALIGTVGWLVYKNHHKTATPVATTSTAAKTTTTTTQSANPYMGWKTYTLASQGMTIKYPSSWMATTSSTGVVINSPTSDDYYFSVELNAGTEQQVYLNFLGNGPGTTIATLNVPKSPEQLYLVAQTAGANGTITGLALATTVGSASTSFGVGSGTGTNNVTMSANLIPNGASPAVNNPYSLVTYQAQPDYNNVVKIFQSLSY